MDFSFLQSPRFYAVVLGGVALYLKSKGIFGDAEMVLVATISGAFTAVGTLDSIARKVGGNSD